MAAPDPSKPPRESDPGDSLKGPSAKTSVEPQLDSINPLKNPLAMVKYALEFIESNNLRGAGKPRYILEMPYVYCERPAPGLLYSCFTVFENDARYHKLPPQGRLYFDHHTQGEMLMIVLTSMNFPPAPPNFVGVPINGATEYCGSCGSTSHTSCTRAVAQISLSRMRYEMS